ncbi:glycosyltransferase [Bifidobacterium samirii]|uniref:Glycosyltransferase n=1 Tax=Bifidobacterium samirii TaxID=2306974 RepID=A0A430FTX0_9BIFI|nr:glycosyltransferase [Bifidobacterium samirii]RSX56367.1 hypothetical protein D2E24_1180 [Bifidobacterium samirii]
MALLAVLAVECAVFNLPFWSTLSASTDSSAATNAMGAGLVRDDDGMLRVVDPTAAYLDLTADGTSDYVRVDVAATDDATDTADTTDLLRTFHLRFDLDGAAGDVRPVCVNAPRSRYARTGRATSIRVWVQEPAGSRLPLAAVRANAKVPFLWSWARVALLSAVVALCVAWRPGSRLWRTRLDPADRAQRRALAATLGALGVAVLATAGWSIAVMGPLTFHDEGWYTYDFDQYAHVADALLHGRVWLDLPVSDALAAAQSPYDVDVRASLLASGDGPLYWDYAYHDGHWYSYFGVLPAVLLYLPYQALTGRMLPTGAAVPILMFMFTVAACLLIVRLLHRFAPSVSLAAASMAVVGFLIGANACYLWFRTNFYSVPIAASLAFTCLGLWFWLGALPQAADDTATGRHRPDGRVAGRPHGEANRAHAAVGAAADAGTARRRRHRDAATGLSLPHLAAGGACIAANFGCRPTFCLAALLAFPLFWTQIARLAAGLRARLFGVREALRAPLAIVLPALVVVAPLMAYNAARFGSPLDFGSVYQMTITDMVNYRLPSVDVPFVVFYYLFAPLRFAGDFPALALQPTPLPEWAFTEPVVGGLFALCPMALLAFLLPCMRTRLSAAYRRTLTVALVLALVLVVVDSFAGGLGWRYMADFGWLFSLACLPAFVRLADGTAAFDPPVREDSLAEPSYRRTPAHRYLLRLAVMLLMMAMLAVALMSCFVRGRSDSLSANNPALFHEVRSWFALLGIG